MRQKKLMKNKFYNLSKKERSKLFEVGLSHRFNDIHVICGSNSSATN
jgi:hypothetical protein